MDWTAWDERQRKRYGVRYFPEPRGAHYGQLMWCKWCDKRIPKVIDGKSSTQRQWHPECKQLFLLHTNLPTQMAFLIDRDGEKCAMIGCGCRPMKWLAGPVYNVTADCCYGSGDWKDEFIATHWWRPKGPWAERTEEEQNTGAQQSIDRVLALEVDHRIPLWEVAHLPDDERRWYFGPDNLWLLCPTCHKAKTRREAARRAFEKRMSVAQLDMFAP